MITTTTRWSHYLQMLSEVCTHICLMVKPERVFAGEGISCHRSRRISRSNTFRGMMQPRCDYSNMHLFVMKLSWSVLHVEAMIKSLEGLKVDHRAYPLTKSLVKIAYCLSTTDRLKKVLVTWAKETWKKSKHSLLRTRLQVWLIKIQRYTWQADDFSWDSNRRKVLYLIACENIEVYALPDTSNISSRRNLVC